MTDSLTTSWVTAIDAALDDLGDSPSAADVYYATQNFDPGYVAAAAIERGGGGALQVIGPFEVAHDTPGFVDPDDSGINIGPTIPAGSLVVPHVYITESFNDAGGDLEVGLGDANTFDTVRIGAWGPDASVGTIAYTEAAVLTSIANLARPALLSVDTQLYTVFWSSGGGATTGEATIYAFVYTGS